MSSTILDHEPNEESSVQMPVAGRWPRIAAHIIDSIFSGGLSAIAVSIYMDNTDYYTLYMAVMLVLMVYKPFFEYRFGATFGKMAMRLLVVRQDLNRISLPQAIVRDLVFGVGCLLEMIKVTLGLFAPEFNESYEYYLTDGFGRYDWYSLFLIAFVLADIGVWLGDQGRSLHDRIAKTMVVVKPEDYSYKTAYTTEAN